LTSYYVANELVTALLRKPPPSTFDYRWQADVSTANSGRPSFTHDNITVWLRLPNHESFHFTPVGAMREDQPSDVFIRFIRDPMRCDYLHSEGWCIIGQLLCSVEDMVIKCVHNKEVATYDLTVPGSIEALEERLHTVFTKPFPWLDDEKIAIR
jgi:hypothetical protein